KEGVLMIQTSEVADADLIAKLQAIASQRKSDKIFLRADGALPYTRVAEVMGALSAGGFSNIGLVTDAGGPKMDGN
ncbi:MAG: biopolymer transporter ExbD, partial [Cypionkella sp.]|nr:biopolymer transporter ExbD [Cypionkella sp.]